MVCRGVSITIFMCACAFQPPEVQTPGATSSDGGGPPGTDGGNLVIDPPDAGAMPSEADAASTVVVPPTIYAHTETRLYEVDLVGLTAAPVGDFAFPSAEARVMSDLAVDAAGHLVGVSFDRVYMVGPETGGCTFLATLDNDMNGLAFVPPGVMDASREILVAVSSDGSVYRIDPVSGASNQIGAYGTGIDSSGDLVYAPGRGLYATVVVNDSVTDYLARIDPADGHATVVGDTGYAALWGLAWFDGAIYGFNPDGQLVRIDPTTGEGSPFASASLVWYGAATSPQM